MKRGVWFSVLPTEDTFDDDEAWDTFTKDLKEIFKVKIIQQCL
jgi:hypothetical protein